MTFSKIKYGGTKGFTLIETVVGSAVFVLLALSGYKAFSVIMEAVSVSQAKVAASTLASEKFEIMRNLPYGDVGIQNGLPSGKISRNETIVRDNYSFDLTTTIRNVDDPFDGTIGGNPGDSSPADYKLVDLDINCAACRAFSPLKFTTLVSPHALETASTNGALFINVFDTSGIPVSGASVHISNTAANPDIIIDEVTDNAGWIKIIDAPPGTNSYNIVATKEGYTEDRTYPPGGAAGANPLNPDATVVLSQVTQASLLIDMVSSLAVTTVDSACAALPNVDFSITGTKLVGTGVLKYPAKNFSTNSLGSFSISDLEWDTYSVLLASPSYDLAGVSPFPVFTANPGETIHMQMIAVPHADNALLVAVEDPTHIAVDGATVRLEKQGFDETKTTGGLCAPGGQVFWNSLQGTYTLTVSKIGFQTSISSVDISSPWQQQTITLKP